MIAHEIQIINLLEVVSKAQNTFIVYVSYSGPSFDDYPYKDEQPFIDNIAKNIPYVLINGLPIARHLYFNGNAYFTFDIEKDARTFFDQIDCDSNDYGIFAVIITPQNGIVSENT